MAADVSVNVDTSALPFLGLALQGHFDVFRNLTLTQIASYPKELGAILSSNDTDFGTLFVKMQYVRAFGNNTAPSDLVDIMNNHVDHTDRHMDNIVQFAIMTPFMILFVGLRLWSRKAVVGKIWWSDWLILVGAISTLVYEVIYMMGPIFGGSGLHMWDVRWDQFVLNLKISYFCLCYYSVNILPIKLSLLFFYNTISQQRYYQWAVKIMGVLITLSTIIFTFLNLFMCLPLGWYNDPSNPDIKCMDKLAILRAQGVMSFMTDIIILVLPVSVIVKLKMGWFQKISVILLFFLGGIGAITSIIRLHTLVNFVEHTDYTYVEGETAFWTILEAQIGIICCSAPALKALISKYMPNLFSRASSHGRRVSNGDGAQATVGTTRHNTHIPFRHDDKFIGTGAEMLANNGAQQPSSSPWNETIINREPIPSRNSRQHKRPPLPMDPSRGSIRSGNLSLSDVTAVDDFEEYEMKSARQSALRENDSVRESQESWPMGERRVHDHV